MSPVCQLEMTLPRGFAGGVWGDGSADERSRAAAARGGARFGSAAVDDRGGGAAARARAPSSVSGVEGISDRRSHLQFVASESTFAYFHAARAYLEAWGKPVAFYSDKHGVFRVNHPGALGGDGMTQFGRALHALDIDIICAN